MRSLTHPLSLCLSRTHCVCKHYIFTCCAQMHEHARSATKILAHATSNMPTLNTQRVHTYWVKRTFNFLYVSFWLTHTDTHAQTHSHAHTHTRTHTHKHTHTYKHTNANINTYTHAHKLAKRKHTNTHTSTNIPTQTHVCKYVCVRERAEGYLALTNSLSLSRSLSLYLKLSLYMYLFT